MAKTKKKELKNLSVADLTAKLYETKKELMKENSQIATGTMPKSPGRIRLLKKTIARINTFLNAKKVKKQSLSKNNVEA